MIHVTDGWYISADKYTYKLFLHKGLNKDGTVREACVSYHDTVTDCFRHLMKRFQLDTIAKSNLTIPEVLEEFRKLNEQFENILCGLSQVESLGEKL